VAQPSHAALTPKIQDRVIRTPQHKSVCRRHALNWGSRVESSMLVLLLMLLLLLLLLLLSSCNFYYKLGYCYEAAF